MPPKQPYDPGGVEHFPIKDFKFSDGTVKDIQIAYRPINPSAEKTTLIPTCFGGLINTTLTFRGSALSNYHIIVVAMLGNGESSSPSNDPSFPRNYTLRYQDCVNAQYALLTQHFRKTSLDVVLGFSMGGQQAWYWAVMHSSASPANPTQPPFLKAAIAICSSAKTSPHNYAFLEGPIAALTSSASYAAYRENGTWPSEGLRAFGRAYAAWLTSAAWFRQELWSEMGASSLHEWLHPPPGQAKNERWDLEDLLVLVRMWQNGDVGDVAPKGEWIKRNCRSYMTHEFSNYIAFMGLELQYLIRRAKFLVREYVGKDLDLLFSTPLYSGWITRKVRFLKRKPMWTFDKHLRGFPNMEITLNSVKKGRSPAPGPHYTGSEINGRCNMSPKWDLTIVNWLLVIADFKILQHNVNEALVTYEIDYCLLPSLEKLFENASKWPSLPLTFKSIKESDVGLLRWLLMSYGGAALWNEYATMVSNKIVKTTLDAVDEGRFNHRQIPSDFKERVDWLYYYWGMLQEDMFFDRIGGPLLNSEKDRKRRNDVLKRAHGISTFVSDNEENLVLSQDELLMWVWKALSKVEEALNRSGQHHSRIGLPPKLQGMKDAQRSELEFKLASWPRKAVKAVSAKQDKTPEAQGHCNHANNHALGLGRKLTTNDQRIQRSISSIVEGIGAMESSLSTISNESQIKEGRNSLASQISRTEHPYEPDANPYSSISRADVRKEALQRFPEVETRYQNYGKVSMTSKVLKASNIEGMRKYESMVNLREIQKREAEKQAQGQRELEAQKRKQQELERKGKRERKESEKQALQQSEAQRQREFEQRREKERMAAEVMEKFETELLAGAERARAREQEKKAAQQREAKESASLQLKPAAQVKPSGYANHAPPASHASHGTHANQHFPPAESQASASKQPKTHQRYSPPTFLVTPRVHQHSGPSQPSTTTHQNQPEKNHSHHQITKAVMQKISTAQTPTTAPQKHHQQPTMNHDHHSKHPTQAQEVATHHQTHQHQHHHHQQQQEPNPARWPNPSTPTQALKHPTPQTHNNTLNIPPTHHSRPQTPSPTPSTKHLTPSPLSSTKSRTPSPTPSLRKPTPVPAKTAKPAKTAMKKKGESSQPKKKKSVNFTASTKME